MQEKELPFFNLLLPNKVKALEVEYLAKEYLQNIGARRADIMLIKKLGHDDKNTLYIVVYQNKFIN